MTKGIASGGVDFDALFDQDVMGDGPSSPGLSSGGVALKYAALKYGTKRANVGYALAGADVSNLWAAKGTAVYALPFNGQTFSLESTKVVGITNGTSITATMKADGTYSVDGVANEAPEHFTNGTWLPAGQSASDYQIQFSVTETSTYEGGGATVTNDAPAYAASTADRQVKVSLIAGGFSSPDKGGAYTVVLKLKRLSTGIVQTTTFYFDLHQINHSQ